MRHIIYIYIGWRGGVQGSIKEPRQRFLLAIGLDESKTEPWQTLSTGSAPLCAGTAQSAGVSASHVSRIREMAASPPLPSLPRWMLPFLFPCMENLDPVDSHRGRVYGSSDSTY